MLTDGAGVPLGLAVAGANTHDMRMVEETLDSIPIRRPSPRRIDQNLCGDKGYDYAAARTAVDERGYIAHIPKMYEDVSGRKHRPGSRARRWVVERTHSWMNRFRRLYVRWEKKAENYIAFLHFACAWITLRAARVLG